MAPSLLFKLVLLSLLVSAAIGARDHPKTSDNKADVKKPEFLVTGEPQPTVLIPGMGRYLLPPKFKKPLYPYNPITGAPLTGGDLPSIGSSQGTGPRTQIPGGDDTLVPSPANSVPTPPTPTASGTLDQVPPVPQP